MQSRDWVVHHSQLACYRRPFGAAACGQVIELAISIRADRVAEIRAVELRLWHGQTGEALLPMQYCGQSGEWCRYATNFTAPQSACLLWYFFIIRLQSGETLYYGNNELNLGGEGRLLPWQPESYQITVVPAETATPDWWKRAVVYQIFPDRFANGREDGSVRSPRKGCLLHAHWDDDPVYIKDEKGRVLAYDFFGGNLAGVRRKLGYLQDLGITAIYFNPLFASPSNHKYDTADYLEIDQMFGANQEFAELCEAAAACGIAVMLDGVFSHTGSDSRYFNREGNYPELGAYQSRQSPYYSWYRFKHYPDSYECWWGVDTLPNVNELDHAYREFIINGENSVLKHWLRLGAKGWRLDVADELPDEFIKEFRQVLKQQDPQAILLGEVWEDASRKVSYGKLREYLWGSELDSVMNYPFRQVVLDFLLQRIDATAVHQQLMSLYENYPKAHFFSALNLIGSHDTPRALTVLGEAPPAESLPGTAERAKFRLSSQQRQLGIARLKLAVLWQMTFPGVPSVYYGDEAGLEGYGDPLNRRTYPWNREDSSLIAWYRQLINLRNSYPVLQTGDWQSLPVAPNVYGYLRRISGGKDVFGQATADNTALVLINRSDTAVSVKLDLTDTQELTDMLCGEQTIPAGKAMGVTLAPYEGKVLLSRPQPRRRGAGILLHPTSLPGGYGIGDMGPAAYAFIDWLSAAGQQYWQILPLCTPGLGNSPYQALSAFAGNPLLISSELLAADGLLTAEDLAAAVQPAGSRIDFAAVRCSKEKLFRQAFSRFVADAAYYRFCQQEAAWLEDYVLFMALSEQYAGLSWPQWPEAVAKRHPAELARLRRELATELSYHRFLQYLFYRQWTLLKQYANQRGIAIIGDLPLFVAHHSADVWANPAYFALDEQGMPTTVAGVPPDYFSADGQLWGNPQYNWKNIKCDGYRWWLARLRNQFRQADIVRIDHFRGLAAYWEIAATAKSAVTGRWRTGPGEDFLLACLRQLPDAKFIAEDLGVITPDVDALRWRFALPGMQVLQFALPGQGLKNEKHTVLYTGTHDNNTLLGWLRDIRQANSALYHDMLRQIGVSDPVSDAELVAAFVKFALSCRADTVIVPIQDILALDAQARMNIPGTPTGNWGWRLSDSLTSDISRKLANWVIETKRFRT